MQGRDLDTRLHAQPGVKIRKRLVEQEDLRVAYDGAADGDALTLAARELLGQALQIGSELQFRGSRLDLLLDLCFRQILQLERIGHVVEHVHMRVEREGLKHHRNAAP